MEQSAGKASHFEKNPQRLYAEHKFLIKFMMI